MLDTILSKEDQRVWSWLSIVREPNKIRIAIDQSSGCLTAWCNDFYTARELWRSRYLLGGEDFPTSLQVYVNRRLYASGSVRRKPSNTLRDMNLSTWVKQNSKLFNAIPGLVFLHSADTEFRFLAVKPDITERQFNRPIVDLIGQPLRVTDNRIAMPKERAIEEAIATGENQFYSYDYHWKGLFWQFEVSVIPLPDMGEVMVMVRDSEQASWQRGYWLNATA
jgi:hypothetical protein